jgi:epoxide hydrolase-like predicted phosphatase
MTEPAEPLEPLDEHVADVTDPIEAVLFDFAGVLVTSPWTAMAEAGGGSLELLIGPYHQDTDHPWHRVERGEIPIAQWAQEVAREGAAQGVEVDFSPLERLLGDMELHHQVLDRVRSLRAAGYRTGLVTNNVREGSATWRAMFPVEELFEVVVDSCEVGMRKPNPAIFQHALELLGGIPPQRAVFLDDSPGNVAGARRAGLHAIVVRDPDQALAELDALLALAPPKAPRKGD